MDWKVTDKYDIEELFSSIKLGNKDIFDIRENEVKQFAFFKNGEQYTETFADIDGDTITEGIFNNCIVVRSADHYYNIIYLKNGCTVLPNWVDNIEFYYNSIEISDGDYVGYAETSEGVLMIGGISKTWWPFNWGNNKIERNPYKETYDDLKSTLSCRTIAIADYLYDTNVELFNDFIKDYVE